MPTLPRSIRRSSLYFLLASTFITYMGTGIVIPILPALVGDFTSSADKALVVGILTAVFSLVQFASAPALGQLSDRYGRRPVLLACLLGTAIGYLIFGIGGALWVLFLGRIIDGITGGNISTVYAYAADITSEKERTRFYGTIGAVGGLGIVAGPGLSALVFQLTGDATAVIWIVAALTLLVTAWGSLTLDESLPAESRTSAIRLGKMNPLSQLNVVFRLTGIRPLLIASFLWSVTYALMQTNLSTFAEDQVGWTVGETSLAFFLGGVFTVVSQGLLIKRLLPILGEARLALSGFGIVGIGYMMIIGVAGTGEGTWLYLALILCAVGIGMISPSMNGMLSLTAGAQEQGQVQGGNQSVQAVARMIAPLWAGWIYQMAGAAAPYASGLTLLIFAAWLVAYAGRSVRLRQGLGAREKIAISRKLQGTREKQKMGLGAREKITTKD